MGRFTNFSQWRGRWPHWRADGETYYVSFRHRRALSEEEREKLFRAILKGTRKFDVMILGVLPEQTELLGRPHADESGSEAELSDEIEKAKKKAAKEVLKKSGERFAPWGFESFDRIMRDDDELQTYFDAILERPEKEGHVSAADEYEWLYVSGTA
ncbi:MAG: hypothetical protein KF812_06265 [Fimbriimonadaceae bacterium]|nr:hypothetical protein [Fimbriimonadaceae bacterium]